MKTITRKLWFSAGHRLKDHEGACAHLHGHNYVLYVTAQSEDDELDSIGRVIDFSVLKDKFEKWLNDNWDHAFLWNYEDPICRGMFTEYAPTMSMKNYPCHYNPTAENMAEYLLTGLAPVLMQGTGVTIIQIKLFETENCYAVVTLNRLTTNDGDPGHPKTRP